MQPNRAYDALYGKHLARGNQDLLLLVTQANYVPAADNVYTVAGIRDHYREQTRAGGIFVDKIPQFNNFFSELQHFPCQTFQ